MAVLKKNQLNQIMFPMVLSADFASIKSNLGAASVTGKFFGVNHGTSAAFTSGAISKATALVRSGTYRVTLKAAETNYDYLMFLFDAVSCATQVLTFQAVDNDDSDIMSMLTSISAIASDAMSAAQQANSRVIINVSVLSDLYSQVSDFRSDLQSLLTVTGIQINASAMSDLRSAIAAGPAATVTASDISDIASAVWANTIGARVDSRVLIVLSTASDAMSAAREASSRALVTQSMASVAAAQATQGNSRALVVQSMTSDVYSQAILTLSTLSDIISAVSDFRSDLHSFVSTTGVQLNASTMSDIRSAISGGPAATVTTSDISDIASAVRAILQSDLSDILSAARQATSQTVLVRSLASDTASMTVYLSALGSDIYSLISDFYSDFQSRVTGAVATASDVASRVWAEKYTAASNVKPSTFGSLLQINMSRISDVNSMLTYVSAIVSDIYSQVSDFRSDLHSLISTTGVNINVSAASDIASQVWAHATANALNSRMLLTQSAASDAASFAQQAASRALIAQSAMSDVYSNLQAGVFLTAGGRTAVASRVWSNAIGTRVDSRVLRAESAASDAASGVSDLRSLVSLVGVKIVASDMSDLRSAIAAGPAATVTASDISDIASAVWANAIGARVDSRVIIIKSQASDTYSLLSDALSAGVKVAVSDMSDLRSAIAAGPAGAVTISDISDIASRTYAVMQSDLSDILSAARQGASQTILVRSMASDAASAAQQAASQIILVKSNLSDVESALDSQYAAGHILTVSALSDIGSRVWADTTGAAVVSQIAVIKSTASDAASAAQQANSRALVVQSLISDVDSALTSRASDISSQLTIIQSMASDAASAAQQASSRALVVQSIVSDVYSAVALVKAQTDNLPSAVKKNTQLANFEFLMVDSTDHVTPKTGLTVSATRSIDGAAFAACSNAPVEVSNGVYRHTLSAGDLNGTVITVRYNATNGDDRFVTFLTKP
jgi:hypothetical protein